MTGDPHYGPKMTVCVYCIHGTARRLLWLEWSKRGREKLGDEQEEGGGQSDRQRGALRPWQGPEQERHWRFLRVNGVIPVEVNRPMKTGQQSRQLEIAGGQVLVILVGRSGRSTEWMWGVKEGIRMSQVLPKTAIKMVAT